jgi:hypothetical protein
MQAVLVQLADMALKALAGGAGAQDEQVVVRGQERRDTLSESDEMLLAARLAGCLRSAAASVANG